MPPAAAIGAGIAGAAIGGAGAVAANNASKRSANLAQQGIDAFQGLGVPDIADQRVALQQLQSQGQLSPNLESAVGQGNTELGKVSDDPRLRQAQMDALSKLQQIGNDRGLDPQARQQLAAIQTSEDQAARGRRGAILQNAQARGVGGSGLELAAQLESDQGAANNQSTRDQGTAATAQQRALDALQQGNNIASGVRSQDYGENAQAAQAQDAINRFNASNQQNVQNTNVQNTNQAQAQNLAEKQRIADTNTGLGNSQQMYNKSLIQQQYDNQLNQARGVAGQAGVASNAAIAQGQAMQNSLGGLGKTLVGAGTTLYTNQPTTPATKQKDPNDPTS